MNATKPCGPEDVRRIVKVVSADDRRAPALLAYDVLSHQAEGGSLYSGKRSMRKRAEKQGVTRKAAETELGNVLRLLERGPESGLEWGLVAGFAVAGLSLQLRDEDEAQARARMRRFVEHAEWLELCTPHRVYAFAYELLDERQLRWLCEALADRIIETAEGPEADEPAARALNAARLTALLDAPGRAAADAVERVRGSAQQSFVRALMGQEVTAAPASGMRVRGVAGRVPEWSVRSVVRWLSGWALLSAIGRTLAAVTGLRRELELELSRDTLRVHRRVRFLGRVIRERDAAYPVTQVGGACRHARYPALHLVVGLLSLSVGVLLGGWLLVDALRAGELTFLWLGAGIIALGAGLDLALDALVPASRQRVALDVRLHHDLPLRLKAVARDEADAFVAMLGERFGTSG